MLYATSTTVFFVRAADRTADRIPGAGSSHAGQSATGRSEIRRSIFASASRPSFSQARTWRAASLSGSTQNGEAALGAGSPRTGPSPSSAAPVTRGCGVEHPAVRAVARARAARTWTVRGRARGTMLRPDIQTPRAAMTHGHGKQGQS
ncbi:hypothetical protein GA0115253_108017 [Streptomyces sp. Termitarium-T10T-6]|nr:hypothetical protein GA0115253_108017 [Streptomyces sp. Termitarium-T10T-6]